jgi:hypothetical protein
MTTKLIPAANIAQRIHFIHGKRVMLDRDLAQLYGVKPSPRDAAVVCGNPGPSIKPSNATAAGSRRISCLNSPGKRSGTYHKL